jgi:hypothetical protein
MRLLNELAPLSIIADRTRGQHNRACYWMYPKRSRLAARLLLGSRHGGGNPEAGAGRGSPDAGAFMRIDTD